MLSTIGNAIELFGENIADLPPIIAAALENVRFLSFLPLLEEQSSLGKANAVAIGLAARYNGLQNRSLCEAF